MSKHPTFTVILRWSHKQNAYIGQLQELAGVEGSGKSYEEALASVLKALRGRQERNGEEEPSPFSQMLMQDAAEPEEDEEPPEVR